MNTTDTSFPVMSLDTFNNSSYQEERKQARKKQLEQMEQAFATASMVQENEGPDAVTEPSMHSSSETTRNRSVRGGSIRRARDLVTSFRGLSTRANSEEQNLAPYDSEEHLPNSDLMEDVDMHGHIAKKERTNSSSIGGFCEGLLYTIVGLLILMAEATIAFWSRRTRRQKVVLLIVFVAIPILITIIVLATKDGGSSFIHNGSHVELPNLDDEPIYTKRYGEIRSNIVESGLTSEGVVDAKGTAQNLALRWITDYDKANLDTDHDALLQRYSLAVFFFSTFVTINATHVFNSAGTESEWTNSDYWMSEKGICMWYGISCPSILHKGEEEIHYNDNTAVLHLNLTENNVRGTIPSEIVALENLNFLELAGNSLQGPIPESIGFLSELGMLKMSVTHFSFCEEYISHSSLLP